MLLPGLLPVSGTGDDGTIGAEVLWVDRFGNAQLNVDPTQLEGWPEAVRLVSGGWSRVARQVAMVPMRRLGTPDDIGAVCVFLASDEAGWLTGEVIQVTGGSRIPVGYLTYMHHITELLAEPPD